MLKTKICKRPSLRQTERILAKDAENQSRSDILPRMLSGLEAASTLSEQAGSCPADARSRDSTYKRIRRRP
jgi:hypothetical protein